MIINSWREWLRGLTTKRRLLKIMQFHVTNYSSVLLKAAVAQWLRRVSVARRIHRAVTFCHALCKRERWQVSLTCHTSHVTRHTSHVTPHASHLSKTCSSPPSSAVFFDWSCQVLVGREQSKSWLMLCQGRTRSVDLLCTRSSRSSLLIVFHSWKLCAQFGAKLHSTLQMHVVQRVALASMKMKRSIFSKFAAMYHRHCHVQVVAKCRSQAL